MITRAKFQNFKALRDVEITFDSRLTVLVGPNGSGKTSVLRAISLLGQVANGQQPGQVLPPEFSPDLTHSGRQDEPQILEVTSSIEGNSRLTVRAVVQVNSDKRQGKWRFTRDVILEGDGQPVVLNNTRDLPESVLQNATFLQLDPK